MLRETNAQFFSSVLGASVVFPKRRSFDRPSLFLFLVHCERRQVDRCYATGPETCAASPVYLKPVSRLFGVGKRDMYLQDKKATTNPNPLPTLSKVVLPSIYPHARNIKSMSKKKRSRNNIQDDRIAAMVNITVKMNHAQTYMANACGNCSLSFPVLLSV